MFYTLPYNMSYQFRVSVYAVRYTGSILILYALGIPWGTSAIILGRWGSLLGSILGVFGVPGGSGSPQGTPRGSLGDPEGSLGGPGGSLGGPWGFPGVPGGVPGGPWCLPGGSLGAP